MLGIHKCTIVSIKVKERSPEPGDPPKFIHMFTIYLHFLNLQVDMLPLFTK